MRKRMPIGLLILWAFLAIPLTSALAEPAVKREYYIVLDRLTKKCAVTDEAPVATSPRTVAVDTRISFETKADAEISMTWMKRCMK